MYSGRIVNLQKHVNGLNAADISWLRLRNSHAQCTR
jgi:hypothetical protein